MGHQELQPADSRMVVSRLDETKAPRLSSSRNLRLPDTFSFSACPRKEQISAIMLQYACHCSSSVALERGIMATQVNI
jgi:hypothetical protein